jgi:hypothetical protein
VAATLRVAANGNDSHPGTDEKPLASLERARDEIRRMKAGDPLPRGGITVEIRGGIYELARPPELTDQDCRTRIAPIVYRARRGEAVRAVGGRAVRGRQLATDQTILNIPGARVPVQGAGKSGAAGTAAIRCRTCSSSFW